MNALEIEELDRLLKFCIQMESCEIRGHIPIHEWVSEGTNSLTPPPGCPMICARCKITLEDCYA